LLDADGNVVDYYPPNFYPVDITPWIVGLLTESEQKVEETHSNLRK